jgi:hypothetical protein
MKPVKSFRNTLGLGGLALLFALSAIQVGCLGQRGPSEVAQGHRYESGDPTYDQFFQAVHELQVEMGKAPGAEAELRVELGKTLGVKVEDDEEDVAPTKPAAATTTPDDAADDAPSATDPYKQQLEQAAINAVPGGAQVNAISQQVKQAQQTFGQLKSMFGTTSTATTPEPAAAPKPVKKAPKAPSASILAKAVKSQAKKLGLEMRLEVDREEAKATLRTDKRADADDAKKLTRAVEEAATAELEILVHQKSVKKKLAKLSTLSKALDAAVDSAFRKSRGQAAEVRKNLGDAQALIELMQTRSDDLSKKAERMVAKLEDAARADLQSIEPKPTTEATQKAVAAKSEPKEKPATSETAEPKKAKSAEAKAPAKKHAPRQVAKGAGLGDFEP